MKYTAKNELCLENNKKDSVTNQKKSQKNSVLALQIHQSYQFHWDFSSSQSESPCSFVLEFPIQFPKCGMNLSIKSGSHVLFGCGTSTSL